MEDEYLTRCVVDTSRRTVYIYSNEGDKKTVECDTPEEFMSVLNYVREHAPVDTLSYVCLLYTSPSPRDRTRSRMPSSA